MSEATSDDMNYIERVEHYREDVHEELADTYDSLLGQGCAPRVAAGTLRYVAGQLGHDAPINQTELSDEYDISGPTIRKWVSEAWQERTGEEWDGPVTTPRSDRPSSGPQSNVSSTSARAVYHTLYHAETTTLTTPEVSDHLEYSYGCISETLRDLAKMGLVGGRPIINAMGGMKEWWAVARNDTPEHEYSTNETAPTATVLREIGNLRGWTEADRSYGSEGEYRITPQVNGTTTTIRDAGFEDLTGETDTLSQTRSLVEEYGLDPDADMNISLTLNKQGLLKILKHEKEVSR